MDKEDLHPQTREEHYCEEHDMVHVRNKLSQSVCPFCEADY